MRGRAPSAVAVSGVDPNFFYLCSNQLVVHRWYNAQWEWIRLGAPWGVALNWSVGVVAVDGYRPYAYFIGDDGNLWLMSFFDGTFQGWHNLGHYACSDISSSAGVVAVDSASRPQA